MTNREKAELCDLARRCATCSARSGVRKFNCKIENCDDEYSKNLDWLMEDYALVQCNEPEEQEVDWSEIPVDTLIEVSADKKDWQKRYFARYVNGKVFAWNGGTTSKTVSNESCVCWWGYARLVEEE